MSEYTKRVYHAAHPKPKKTRTRVRNNPTIPGAPTPDPMVTHLAGFAPMTRVSTSFGEVPAYALRERDMVRTRDGAFKKIVAIDRIVLDESFMQYHPSARPVMIREGALGLNLPERDIQLAPYQSISPAQRFSGKPLKRAVDALGRPNVHYKPEALITYTVVRCEEPTALRCEGIWIDCPSFNEPRAEPGSGAVPA